MSLGSVDGRCGQISSASKSFEIAFAESNRLTENKLCVWAINSYTALHTASNQYTDDGGSQPLVATKPWKVSRLTLVCVCWDLWVNRANWWFGCEQTLRTLCSTIFLSVLKQTYGKINIQTRRFGPSRRNAGFLVAGRLWLLRFVIVIILLLFSLFHCVPLARLFRLIRVYLFNCTLIAVLESRNVFAPRTRCWLSRIVQR